MFSKLFTVKLTKPLTIELQRIILWKLFYCVARRKLIRRAKTILQTKMVISLWFYSLLACPEIFYCDSQGHYTIKIPEIYFSGVYGFVSLTVKIILQCFEFCQQLSSSPCECHRQYLELHMYAITGGTCMRNTFVHISDKYTSTLDF